jgi:membrane associated rhomboid family serine protease
MQFPPLTPVVRNLLLINVGMFALEYLLEKNFGIPLSHWLALKYVGAETFLPSQFITYMFLHGDFGHLFMNMLGLFFLGTFLEMTWGGKRFLLFYMITGIGAGFFYSVFRYFDMQTVQVAYDNFMANPSYEFLLSLDRTFPYNYQLDPIEVEGATGDFYKQNYGAVAASLVSGLQNVGCVGASGSLFGIIAGLGLVMPNREMLIFPLPFPIKMKYFAIFYFLLELKSGIFQVPGDNVAHFAHIGGAVVAFVYIQYWEKIRKRFS